VNELVRLGDLAHHLEDDLLAVSVHLLETLVACRVVISRVAHTVSSTGGLVGLTHESTARKNTLLADAVGDVDLE